MTSSSCGASQSFSVKEHSEQDASYLATFLMIIEIMCAHMLGTCVYPNYIDISKEYYSNANTSVIK